MGIANITNNILTDSGVTIGAAGGVATLDSGGKIPVSQLPNSVMEFKGTWSAATNTPTLANGTGNAGDVYEVSDAGTVNFGAGGIAFAVGDYVVYDGATWQYSSGQKGTITSVALTVPSAFSVSGSPITTSGTLAVTATGDTTQYIAGDGSLITFPVAGQSGTLVREVRNTTGATLTKGTIVYISGATGNKPTVSKAIATGDSTSAQTFGMCQANISNNSNGYVVCVGDLGGLDTSGLTEGAQLYLSSTTAGTYTTTKQLAPNHLVYIGVVTRAHPTQGQIEVNIQNGYELYELHDVSITSEADNQGLFYESATDLWKNKTIATVLGYTPEPAVTAGTTAQYYRGDKTFQTLNTTAVAEGTNLYYTEARVSANTNVAANTAARHNAVTLGTANGLSLSTQALSLGLASASANGALSSTDWTTFNNKQNALTNPVTGTGTTNYLSKFTGASTVGNSLIFDNGTKVGIGTSSIPTSRFLAVSGSAQFNGAALMEGANFSIVPAANGQDGVVLNVGYDTGTDYGSLFINTGGNTSMTLTKNGAVTFAGSATATSIIKTGGTSSQFLMADGSVSTGPSGGITGSLTTNFIPRATGATTLGNSVLQQSTNNIGLSVTPSAGGLSGYSLFEVANGGASIYAGANQSLFGTNIAWDLATPNYKTTNFASVYNQQSGQHIWYTAASGTAGGAITWSQNMTLFANGNLAVGPTADAGFKLDINGSVNVSANNFYRYNGNTGIIGSATAITGGVNTQLGIRASSDILFATNGANERMRITSDGNVGIGNGGNASRRLEVSQPSGYSAGIRIIADSGGDAKIQFLASGGSSQSDIGPTAASPNDLFFGVGGTPRMSISSGGTVSINSLTGPIDNANQKLQVYGAIRQDVLGSSYNEGIAMNFPTGGTTYGGIFMHSTTPMGALNASSVKWQMTYNYAPEIGVTGGGLAFTTTNTNTRMLLTSGGNVLIGTTTDAGFRLDVNGTGRFSGNVLVSKSSEATVELNSTTAASYSAIVHSESGTAKAYWEYVNSAFSIAARRNYLEAFNSVGGFGVYTAGAKALDITTTGAATFSSSVTAVGSVIAQGGLDIYGSTGSTKFLITSAGAGNALGLLYDASNVAKIQLYTTGNSYFNGGNVGIGTTSPASATADKMLSIVSSAPGITLESTGVARKWDITANWGGGTAFLDFYDETAARSAMVIRASGNVGIGTTNPSVLLQVSPGSSYAGNPTIQVVSSFADGYDAIVSINNTHTGGRNWQIRSTNNSQGNFGGGKLVFQDASAGAGTSVMTLATSGNVIIGTTTDNGAGLLQIGGASNGKISLTGGSSQNGMRWESVAGANVFYLFNGNFGPGPGWGLYNVSTAGLPFWILNSGAATFGSSVTATSFFESSSVAYKNILATNPVTSLNVDVIKYKRTNVDVDDVRYGYSAEQINSLMPELTNKEATAVKYLDVHTLLIAELQREIKELKAKLN
jgi:hypothetical protein